MPLPLHLQLNPIDTNERDHQDANQENISISTSISISTRIDIANLLRHLLGDMTDLKMIELRREKSDHHEIDTGALHQRKKIEKSEDDRLPQMPAALSCLTRGPNTMSKSVNMKFLCILLLCYYL